MCVTCKIPLNVAQSPQADRERAYIQSLIDEGHTEAQIKHALVGQYGPAVLGLPGAHGFDLTAYLVPLAAVLAVVTHSPCSCPAGGATPVPGPGRGARSRRSTPATPPAWTRTSRALTDTGRPTSPPARSLPAGSDRSRSCGRSPRTGRCARTPPSPARRRPRDSPGRTP